MLSNNGSNKTNNIHRNMEQSLEVLNDYCDKGLFDNEYLWNTYFPEFLNHFKFWIELEPDSESIKTVSIKFGGIMKKILKDVSVLELGINDAEKLFNDANAIISQVTKNVFCSKISDQTTRNKISSCTETDFYTYKSDKFRQTIATSKERVKKVMKKYVELRNHCLSSDRLLQVINEFKRE